MKNLQNQQSIRSLAPAGTLWPDLILRNVSAHARADLMSKNSDDTKNSDRYRENNSMACLKKICGAELGCSTTFFARPTFSICGKSGISMNLA